MFEIDVSKFVIERANQGLSLEELSEKSGVGRSTISRIERGEVKARINTVAKIAKALGKTVQDFQKN